MNDQITTVTMPKWGLSMSSGKLIEWIMQEGSEIAEGDDLAEIDTDKIAGTLESPGSGVLRKVIVEVGEDVPVGATLALIAPSEVSSEEIDEIARQARDELDSGAVAEVAGPVTGTVVVEGRTIAYASLGEGGVPIVLVHGFGGDKDSWLFVQEPLSADRVVHAIDLPGHGASTKEVGDGSVDTLAGAVLGFLHEMGIERAHLVGHSLGGAVVTVATAREPARVSALTLVAPAGIGDAINAGYLRGFAAATSRRELKPHLGDLFADPVLVTRQLADDLMKYKRLDGVDAALSTLLTAMLDGDAPAIDVSDRLRSLQVPVSVVWGSEDRVLPASNASALTEVDYVDGAGHMVHMEKPQSVVTAVGVA